MLGAQVMGRGTYGNIMGGRTGRISTLIENVSNAVDDPYIAMESLRELSEKLLMMNQIVVDRAIPVEKLLKSIVGIFENPMLVEELELQLMTCRCLYSLFEVDPDCIPTAIEHNIIPLLQKKLQEISYIDLAEQVLETLEFISRIQGKDILRTGQLIVYLQYLDFFTIHAQRKAVSIVANACAKVTLSDFDKIEEVMPILQLVFINANDEHITNKLINTLYGICGGL